NEHFFGTTAAWNQADARLNQANVSFRRRMDPRSVQTDFAAATQRHALWRCNHRFFRVFDGKIDVLELLDGQMKLVPFLLLRSNQHQHQVSAHGKIDRLIGNYHGVEVGFEAFQAFVNHADEIGADGVHLGVELAADDAVAEVDEASAGVAFHFPA